MKRFLRSFPLDLRQIAAIFLFLALFYFFLSGVSNISQETSQKQTETLQLALSRGIAHCYATNGYYPENLDSLLHDYGISYNTDDYFIDYQVLGKNIYPELTIIEK